MERRASENSELETDRLVFPGEEETGVESQGPGNPSDMNDGACGMSLYHDDPCFNNNNNNNNDEMTTNYNVNNNGNSYCDSGECSRDVGFNSKVSQEFRRLQSRRLLEQLNRREYGSGIDFSEDSSGIAHTDYGTSRDHLREQTAGLGDTSIDHVLQASSGRRSSGDSSAENFDSGDPFHVIGSTFLTPSFNPTCEISSMNSSELFGGLDMTYNHQSCNADKCCHHYLGQMSEKCPNSYDKSGPSHYSYSQKFSSAANSSDCTVETVIDSKQSLMKNINDPGYKAIDDSFSLSNPRSPRCSSNFSGNREVHSDCESCGENCDRCCSDSCSSNYSDCGPDCNCGQRDAIPKEDSSSLPEVRWTARLLGGNEPEVEAYKKKKLASMKK